MDLSSLPLQERVAAATKALRVVHAELVLANADLERERNAKLPTTPRPSLFQEVSEDWLVRVADDKRRETVATSERHLARIIRLWEQVQDNASTVWGSDAVDVVVAALGPTS